MDLSALFVVVSGLWMSALTLVTLGLLRQIGLLTVRLDRERQASAPVNDGLAIGEDLPGEVLSQLAVDDDSVGYLLILGAVCAPCRELANDLQGRLLSRPVTALVSGSQDLADSMAELLPSGVTVLRDTGEGELAKSLRIETSPFAFEIVAGKVHGKAILRGADHLLSFIQPPGNHVHGDGGAAALHVQEVNTHAQS